MREIDSDIWIKYLVKKYEDNIIIDDLRFINEFNIKSLV